MARARISTASWNELNCDRMTTASRNASSAWHPFGHSHNATAHAMARKLYTRGEHATCFRLGHNRATTANALHLTATRQRAAAAASAHVLTCTALLKSRRSAHADRTRGLRMLGRHNNEKCFRLDRDRMNTANVVHLIAAWPHAATAGSVRASMSRMTCAARSMQLNVTSGWAQRVYNCKTIVSIATARPSRMRCITHVRKHYTHYIDPFHTYHALFT